MKIVLDLYGGDNAPEELLPGIYRPLDEIEGLKIILAGDSERLSAALADAYKDRVSFVHSTGVLTNNDNPMLVAKGDYSLSRALDECDRNGDCLISVGNTGAVLIGSLIKLGLSTNVTKPALASILPCDKGKMVCLLDCGANPDATAEDLLMFARLGNAYMTGRYTKKASKVALLSLGREEKKGNAVTKKAFGLLSASELDFIGNIEAYDIFGGEADTVVCDGFVGNTVLKNTEAVGRRVAAAIKASVANSEENNKAFQAASELYSFNDRGGAVILGVKKSVIKAHGRANADTIESCIYQACL